MNKKFATMGAVVRATALTTFVAIVLTAPAAAKDRKLPGTSIAGAGLQADVVRMIGFYELLPRDQCVLWQVIDTLVTEPPADVNRDRWVERWTVDHCGKRNLYQIDFLPDPGGGTRFGVSRVTDAVAPVAPPAAPAAVAPGETPTRSNPAVDTNTPAAIGVTSLVPGGRPLQRKLTAEID